MFSEDLIKSCISEYICDGAKSFIIYPCGDNGNRINNILKNYFIVNAKYLVDNIKSELDESYINIDALKNLYDEKSYVILTIEKEELNKQMYEDLLEFVHQDKIINIYEYCKKKEIKLKEKIKRNLALENILPNFHCKIDAIKTDRIKVRIVHGHYPTWNSISSIIDAFVHDNDFDVKVIIGWDKDPRCVQQVKKKDLEYEFWDVYDAKFDMPDILIISQPYDTVTQISNIKKYAKIVVVASVLLIRNTAKIEWFWKVQEDGFARFEPDYYLCDSMLYNEIKDTNTFPIEIIEMGNAKYDGIYKSSLDKQLPSKWSKLAGKKIVLWTTDHGYYPQRVYGVSFDLYAKDIFDFIIKNQNIGMIFRPHPVMLKELISEGYWSGKDLESFIEWCNNSPNIVFDDNETYDQAYSVCHAILADAICGITVSALPTLKPVCITYRTQNDIPFHPELVKNYYSSYDSTDLIRFLDNVVQGIDPMYQQRKMASEQFVKNFDGQNGQRIKEFIKTKYKEKVK